MTDRTAGLGRLPAVDRRDSQYLMRSVVPTTARTWRYWHQSAWWGDQKLTPQCVAYAWLHCIEDGPTTRSSTAHGSPHSVVPPILVYNRAQKIDEWPGENYDGTSVRAGAKVMRDLGYISEYRWAWDINTLVTAVLERGPVVIGTNWYMDMFNPMPDGFIEPTGQWVGGHAYLINGVNVDREVVRIKNSWGRTWGRRGNAWMSFNDLQRLIDENGEACLPIENPEKE